MSADFGQGQGKVKKVLLMEGHGAALLPNFPGAWLLTFCGFHDTHPHSSTNAGFARTLNSIFSLIWLTRIKSLLLAAK